MVENRGARIGPTTGTADEFQIRIVGAALRRLKLHQSCRKILEPADAVAVSFVDVLHRKLVVFLPQQRFQALHPLLRHRIGARPNPPRGVVVQQHGVAAQDVEAGVGQLHVVGSPVEESGLEAEPARSVEIRVLGEKLFAELQAPVLQGDQPRQQALGLLPGGCVRVVLENGRIQGSLPRLGVTLFGGLQQRAPGPLLQFPDLFGGQLSGQPVVVQRLVEVPPALVGLSQHLVGVAGLLGVRMGTDIPGSGVHNRLIRHRVAAEHLQQVAGHYQDIGGAEGWWLRQRRG